jgi:hypothetical protein
VKYRGIVTKELTRKLMHEMKKNLILCTDKKIVEIPIVNERGSRHPRKYWIKCLTNPWATCPGEGPP